MEKLATERLIVVIGSGIQSLVFAILIHSIMSNTLPVGPAFYLGMGTGFATFLSFFNLTLCSAFGSNERVLLVCKFFMLLPLIIFAILFLIGGALQQ